MKKFIFLILIVLSLSIPLNWTLAQTPSDTYVVLGDKPINARACPHLTCAVVTTITQGDAVVVVDTVHGDTVSGSDLWYQTTFNGQDVYVHSSLITKESAAGNEIAGQGNDAGTQDTVSTTGWLRHEGTGMSIEAPKNWEDLTGDEEFIRYWVLNSGNDIASDVLYAQYSNAMILMEPDLGVIMKGLAYSWGEETPLYINQMNTVDYLKDEGYQFIETSIEDLPVGRALRAHYGNRSGSVKQLSNEIVEYALFRDRVYYDLFIYHEDGLPEAVIPVFDAMIKTFEVTSPSDLRHALAFNAGAAWEGENIGKARKGQCQLWTYEGQVDTTVTITTSAVTSAIRGLYARLIVRAPNGEIIAESEDTLSNRVPGIQYLTLPETGIYEIEVYIFGDYKPSEYKLVITSGDQSSLTNM